MSALRFGLALVAVSGFANFEDTSTGVDLNKLPHPQLTRIRGGDLKPNQFDGIAVTAGQAETLLTGKGKSGRAWTVHLCETCAGEIWRGDLDGNGTPDYAIAGVGPYVDGRTTPPYSLSLLLMDADNMPVPFFTTMYHDDAIKHLVQVDGRVQLFISRYDEIPSNADAAPYCSGHWVTQAYGLTNTAVEEVRGEFGGMRFPRIHNWAYSHPECAHNPVGFTGRPKIPDVRSSAKDAVTIKLRATEERALALPVEPVAECEALMADAFVFDNKSKREVVFPNLSGNAQYRVVVESQSADAVVEARGIHDCTASLLWARSSR